MLEELKEIIHKACPEADISAITEDTEIGGDLGIDSLRMMMIVIEIEKRCGIHFKNFPYVHTIGDLLSLIEAARQNG